MKEERTAKKMTLESFNFFPQYPYATSGEMNLKPKYPGLWV